MRRRLKSQQFFLKVLDYILEDLVGSLEKAPISTIITIVANLGYFIANNDVAVVIQNLVAPVLAIVDALGGVISRAQLDLLIEGLVKVELPNGKKLNITNIINIAGDNGAILVDLINGLLPSIVMKDENGNEIGVTNALPDTFFLDLAKAAVRDANGEEFDAEIEKMAAMYQMEVAKLKELISDKEKESMMLDIAVQKAVDFIVAEAK